jgi:hypothetical protein
MSLHPPKPLFDVILGDRDQWSVQVEWPDGTLESVRTFKSHSLAKDWVTGQSELWLRTRKIFRDDE